MQRITILIFSVIFLIPLISYAQYIPKEERENTDSTTVVEEPKTPVSQPTNTQPKTPTRQKRNRDLSNLSFGQRLVFGGNLGLQFGDQTVVDVSPLIGYRITEDFNAGIGVTYFYYDIRAELTINGFATGQFVNLTGSSYGGRVYAQYFVYNNQFFLYTEQELMNTEFIQDNDIQSERRLLFNSLVGGGVFLSFGGRGGINLTLLYNLNHQEDFSIFSSPVVTRVGFMF